MHDRNYVIYIMIALLVVAVAVLSYQCCALANEQTKITIRQTAANSLDVQQLATLLSEPNP
jgi:hypothetical protein